MTKLTKKDINKILDKTIAVLQKKYGWDVADDCEYLCPHCGNTTDVNHVGDYCAHCGNEVSSNPEPDYTTHIDSRGGKQLWEGIQAALEEYELILKRKGKRVGVQ